MPAAKSNIKLTDETKAEHAEVGYQVAASLWTYEGTQNWARFNVMLVANSIVIAIIGLVLTSEHPKQSVSFVMSLVGLFLCLAWFLITKRGFDYQGYYVKSTRELEERFLAETVKTASRGSIFAKGEVVTIELNGKPTTVQMSWWSRWASASHISITVILLFSIVYLLALLQAIDLIQLTW